MELTKGKPVIYNRYCEFCDGIVEIVNQDKKVTSIKTNQVLKGKEISSMSCEFCGTTIKVLQIDVQDT